MRPEAPALYRQSLVEVIGLKWLFSVPSRMILRHISHKPVKSALSVLGIAFACAILMTGRFQEDTVNFMMDVHYGLAQRDDLSLTFSEPTSREALVELNSLPGVVRGEAFRAVPVRLRHEQHDYRTYILGLDPGGELKRLINTDLQPVELPDSGIVMNEYLGKDILKLKLGDRVTVEALEGNQTIREIPVVAMVRLHSSV